MKISIEVTCTVTPKPKPLEHLSVSKSIERLAVLKLLDIIVVDFPTISFYAAYLYQKAEMSPYILMGVQKKRIVLYACKIRNCLSSLPH